jgi:hypothetical protein
MVNGPSKPNQEAYLRALATTPLVDPVLGNFKKKNVECRVALCTYGGKKFFATQEEKRLTSTLRFTCSTTRIGI